MDVQPGMRIAVVDGRATRALRRAVLRPGWPEGSAMHGDDNPAAVHLAGRLDDVVVATCLVLPRAYPLRPGAAGAWQLRGMATDPQYRGRGLGAQLLAGALAELADRQAALLWCEARDSALEFYARNGFTVDGDGFLHGETGIPHHYMWRSVPASGLT